MSMSKKFLCGTRKVIPGETVGTYRVVCASCGAGGTVSHPTIERATTACVRDSSRPCRACGAD
jgi:hypothetical protein